MVAALLKSFWIGWVISMKEHYLQLQPHQHSPQQGNFETTLSAASSVVGGIGSIGSWKRGHSRRRVYTRFLIRHFAFVTGMTLSSAMRADLGLKKETISF